MVKVYFYLIWIYAPRSFALDQSNRNRDRNRNWETEKQKLVSVGPARDLCHTIRTRCQIVTVGRAAMRCGLLKMININSYVCRWAQPHDVNGSSMQIASIVLHDPQKCGSLAQKVRCAHIVDDICNKYEYLIDFTINLSGFSGAYTGAECGRWLSKG